MNPPASNSAITLKPIAEIAIALRVRWRRVFRTANMRLVKPIENRSLSKRVMRSDQRSGVVKRVVRRSEMALGRKRSPTPRRDSPLSIDAPVSLSSSFWARARGATASLPQQQPVDACFYTLGRVPSTACFRTMCGRQTYATRGLWHGANACSYSTVLGSEV